MASPVILIVINLYSFIFRNFFLKVIYINSCIKKIIPCSLLPSFISDRYAPSLHEFGHFMIPTVCDPAALQWFIFAKAQEARENLKRKEE